MPATASSAPETTTERGPVDGGDARVRVGLQQRPYVVLGRLHGEHGAAGRQLLHQSAAGGDQGAGVLQRQHAGDVGGGDLADGVPGDEVGPYAPRFQQAVERDLEGEQGGLGVLGAVQPLGVVAEHEVAQVVAEMGADRVEGVGEDGECLVQATAHPQALGALTGEEEGGLPFAALDAGDRVRAGLARGDQPQPVGQRGAVGAEYDGAVLERGTGRGEGEAEVRGGEVGELTHVVEELCGLGAQGVPAAGTDHPRHRTTARYPARLLRHRLLGHRLLGDGLQHHMRVRAADAERRHTRTARTLHRSGHSRASVSSSTPPDDQSTCGDGSSTCSVAGSTPCRIASTILITPATPAAAWVWPMFDFTEPSHSGLSASRSWPYVASSACASIGSPSVVPVPCASTTSTSAAASPASASAARITRC